jgi:hypothetical protein
VEGENVEDVGELAVAAVDDASEDWVKLVLDDVAREALGDVARQCRNSSGIGHSLMASRNFMNLARILGF